MNDNLVRLSARYESFFSGVIYAALGFAAIELGGALAYSAPALGMAGSTTGILGLLFVVARELLRRQRLNGAIVVASGAGSLAALLYMISLPEVVGGLTLFPLCVVGLAMLNPSRKLFWGASILAVVTVFLVVSLSFAPRFLPPAPPSVLLALQLITPPVVMALLALLLGYTWNNSNKSLAASQSANRELTALRDGLEVEVDQRTRELQSALHQVQVQADEQSRLLQQIERQQATIRELGVPILPVSQTAAVVPLVGSLDSARLMLLSDRTLHAIERLKLKTLLLDLTGVEMLDEAVAEEIIKLANAIQLLGAAVVLIGIRPEVAEAIVALGVDLRGIRSIRDLRTALSEAR